LANTLHSFFFEDEQWVRHCIFFILFIYMIVNKYLQDKTVA
jgi:hypothetical protein